jgi:prepilin-type N-terminal cleavage/methylation domain-containing protein
MRRRNTESGLTLIELMVSLVILSIATAAAFGISFTILNGVRDGKRTSDVEQRVRMAMDYISNTLRGSSPGVTTANIQDLADCKLTGAITVTNSSTAPDEITIVHAKGGVIGFLAAPLKTSESEMTVNADNVDFYDTLYFEDGDYVLVVGSDGADGTNGHLFKVNVKTKPKDATEAAAKVSWVLQLLDTDGGVDVITDLCGGTPPALTEPLLSNTQYDAGSVVLRVQPSRIYVRTDTDPPYLMLDSENSGGATDGEPLAEGIEDLQIEIAIDDGKHGGVAGNDLIEGDGQNGDDDEVYYNHEDDTAPDVIENDPTVPWAALRLTVTARTVGEVQSGAMSTRPAAGDRAVGTVADAFRRRTLSSIVELRNVMKQE